LVYEQMKEPEQAAEQWQLVIKDHPGYRPGWRGWGEMLLEQRRCDEVAKLIQRMQSDRRLAGTGAVLSAKLHEQTGDIQAARRQLEVTVEENPDDLEPLQELCRLLFERLGPTAAEPALTRLVNRDPQDASAWHNLGTTYFETGQFQQAVNMYRRSLEIRPESESTRSQLDKAFRRLVDD